MYIVTCVKRRNLKKKPPKTSPILDVATFTKNTSQNDKCFTFNRLHICFKKKQNQNKIRMNLF